MLLVFAATKLVRRKRNYILFVKNILGSENTFFVCNVKKKDIKIPEGYNSVIFNEDTILGPENLFWPKDAAWRCGDYCYYALWHALSGYEFLWLIENDVKLCGENAVEFFPILKTQSTISWLRFLERQASVYLFIKLLRC